MFVLAVYGCAVLAIATSVISRDWSRGMAFVGGAVISAVVALGMWRRHRDARGSAVVFAAALVVTAVWGESWRLGRAMVGVALLALLLVPAGQRRWFAHGAEEGGPAAGVRSADGALAGGHASDEPAGAHAWTDEAPAGVVGPHADARTGGERKPLAAFSRAWRRYTRERATG